MSSVPTPEATIVKESDSEYQVWFGLPDDPGGWQNNAFIAVSFETFDAATATLPAVAGVRVTHIRSEGGDL